MRHSFRTALTNQRGIALVVALILMGLLGVLASAYTLAIRADTVLRGGSGRERSGFYAAEAGLNYAMAEARGYFANFTPPGAYSDSFSLGSDTHQRTVSYHVTPVPGRNPASPELIPAGQPFAGLQSIPYDYTVTSIAQNGFGDQEATVGGQFTVNSVPIFQFLAFYKDDLEILPGPPMHLSGRIHTSGNLYLNAGSELRIEDRRSSPPSVLDNPFVQLSTGGDIYRGRKDDTSCAGTVIIDMQKDTVPPTPGLDPLELPCSGGGTSIVDKPTRDTYLGSLLAHVTPLQIPTVSTLERKGSGKGGGIFWERADLRIVLNLTAPRVKQLCGLPLPSGNGADGIFAIQVQDSSGGVDTAKTAALQRLMCERRGAIFYNELPQNPPAAMPIAGINTAQAGNNNDPSNPQNYAPPFKTAARVYRRAGEDTNGDGTIDTNGDGVASNNDRNDDICPVWVGPGPIGPRPTWRPDYCDVRFGTWIGVGNIFANTDEVAQTLPSSWFADADYRRGGFYNWREKQWVMMLSVNVRALIDWNEANGAPFFSPNDNSDGGLVFFLSVQADDSSTIPPPADHRYGVRIFDSAKLNTGSGTFPAPNPDDPTGLTVVSDQAVYVEGNYNYYPTMKPETKLPAAVLGDTLNILSQGWEVPVIATPNGAPELQYNNDRKAGSALSVSRNLQDADGYYGGGMLQCANGPCTNFTNVNTYGINAALIAGVDITNVGDYNGGLENYPRFHEDWSPPSGQKTLNYRGSFVSLGMPQYATGRWCGTGGGCNIYDPPARNWDYDASFNDVRLLPPLTPNVNIIQQRMFTRFYQ